MQVLRLISPPSPCGYLPSELSSMDQRLVVSARADWYGKILERGWRRFGEVFFRPACQLCDQCQSIRLPVAHFLPNRSQRRNLRDNCDIELKIQRPTISPEHLLLYNRYHADMAERRGWPHRTITPGKYRATFLAGAGEFAHEFLYFDAGRLIAVALVDLLPVALSSVYFFHDPDLRDRGLGIFSILRQLEFAASNGLTHQYLGFWVEACPSMTYKTQFKPHEFLVGRPSDQEAAIWRAA